MKSRRSARATSLVLQERQGPSRVAIAHRGDLHELQSVSGAPALLDFPLQLLVLLGRRVPLLFVILGQPFGPLPLGLLLMRRQLGGFGLLLLLIDRVGHPGVSHREHRDAARPWR